MAEPPLADEACATSGMKRGQGETRIADNRATWVRGSCRQDLRDVADDSPLCAFGGSSECLA